MEVVGVYVPAFAQISLPGPAMDKAYGKSQALGHVLHAPLVRPGEAA